MEENIQDSNGWDKDNGIEEETVQFKAQTDKTNINIINPETKKSMCVISGYDLSFDFNYESLKSVEDIETCLNGLSELWRKIILNNILGKKND